MHALLALLLSLAPTAPAGRPPAIGAERHFADGTRRVTATPAPLPADAPPGTSAVHLRWDDGRGTPALLDTTALVRITPGAERELRARLTDVGLVLDRTLMPSLGLVRVRDPAGMRDGITLAALLADVEGVSETVPNLYLPHRAAGEFVPNDPRYGGQWFFKQLNMPAAWAYTQGDPETTVVVIDNGCDLQHPDLVGGLDPGRDVVDDDDDPSFKPNSRSNNHGTACAGLVAARTNNGLGVAGACPKCRVRCVRLLNDTGMVSLSADVEAFQFALQTGAAVVSNSWGFSQAIPVPKALADAINHVHDTARGGRGALILFASGNDDRLLRDDELLGVRGVIGVGATNSFDEGTPFTNYGPPVDLVAPTGTLTTDVSGPDGDDKGDYTSNFGGTSSACPVAAGVAGLLVSAAPERSVGELEQLLVRTARRAPYAQPDSKGHDFIYGYGIVDPVRALKAIYEPEVPDAGAEPDAALPPPDPGSAGDAPGCGCGTAGGGRGAFVLLLLLAAGARFRRSARQP